MAELVDARDLKSCDRKVVQVRSLLWAPTMFLKGANLMARYGIYLNTSSTDHLGTREKFEPIWGKNVSASAWIETDETLNLFDAVVASSGGNAYVSTVVEVNSSQPVSAAYLGKIDLTAYQAAKEKCDQEKKLKADLDALIKVQAQIDKYLPYADANPLVAEKLDQLRTLMGLTTTNGKASKAT
jgi:hypothetical protein